MKTKLFNKALSGLLASAMALSVFAIGASAEGECICTEYCTWGHAKADCPVCKDTDDNYRNFINCAQRPTSGTCGATANDSVNWNIIKNGVDENGDDTYTVTISGTGAMEDYDPDIGYPVWSDYYRDFITKIVIGYGITHIGVGSFSDCEKAKEVVIERNASGESSVKTIAKYAFANCEELTEIEIPASVEEIINYAFKSCHAEKITFEEGSALTSIGARCFRGNTSSVECIIPSKVTSIENSAFSGNRDLKRFYYPAGIEFGTEFFCSDEALEYFGRYTVNEANKTCSIEYLGVGRNGTDRFPDENAEITVAEIIVPEKIAGYKVTSVTIGETTVEAFPESLSVSHTTTKFSDIPKKDGWTYTAASDTIPVGTTTVTASYAINETQKITREITISRPSCSYGSSWATNAESHWHECSCGNTSGVGSHTSSGEATPDSAEVCSVCGYEIAPATGYVAVPVISPEGSEFKDEVKITISTETEGAEIFFTTDGSDPTTESEKYSGEITLSQSATIKAIAVKDGMGDSEIASAEFVKTGPQVKNEDGKTGWDAIAAELSTADEKVIVQMNGETEVPAEILALIKGEIFDLVIELDNGFIWTINGKDVTNPADIDLAVNEGSTIPVEVINKVTGEKESFTLTLSHEGGFGFKAVLTLDLGAENKGLFANLYWYTNGGTELISSAEISSDGKADLAFNHASEYVVVIDDENHIESSENTEAPDSPKGDNAETGVALSLVGVITSAALLTVSRKRK